MTTNDRDVVSAVHAALVERIGIARVQLWFGSDTLLEFCDGVLRLHVASESHQSFVRRKFLAVLAQAAREAGVIAEPQIVVRPALADPSPSSVPLCGQPQEDAATPTGDASIEDAARPTLLRLPAYNSSNAANSHAGAELPATAGPRRRPWAELADFVVGDSNRVAHTTAELVLREPGLHSPCFLFGETGVGKTHLLESLLTGFQRLHPQRRAVLLTAEQFTTQFLTALRDGGLPSFRRRCRRVDLLLLDDVQFFSGKRHTLTELSQTVQEFCDGRRQMVLAADRAPQQLEDFGSELVHRLQGGLVARIGRPDFAVRWGVVRQQAQRLGLDVSAEVLRWLAAQLTSHTRELRGALNSLKAASQALGQPITLELAQSVLAEMLCHSARVLRLADIDQAVCALFGLEERALQTGAKQRRIQHPRMLAMFLARKHTRAPLSEIGSYFGQRSHSTVVAAQKKVHDWMQGQRHLDVADQRCSVEEAIRRVEQRLQSDCG